MSTVQELWQPVFLCLGNQFCIKFSLAILLAFFILLWRLYKKDGGGHPASTLRSLSKGDRREVMAWAAFYILVCLAGVCPDGPLQALYFLNNQAEAFLIVEPILGVAMLLFAEGSRLICGSRREYLNTLNVAVRIMIIVSVASMLLVRQISLQHWYNGLWLIVVGILLVGLKLFSLERLPKAEMTDSLFAPVTKYKDLFGVRKDQAKELCRIIESEASGGISICVTGPWGSGKTSLVFGACDLLQNPAKEDTSNGQMNSKADRKANYEFIFLRALELDNLSSLFRYLFTRIREILRARGAYVGPGSEYRKLITSIGGLISSAQLPAVLERQLFPAEEDYRSQRERLETLMKEVMGETDKLLIIVDDIERCEPEKAREFLYFVKEIATMKCCVSIFITDDNNLPLPDHIKRENNATFFEKFFNYRICLSPIQVLEMLEYYEREVYFLRAPHEFRIDLPSVVYPKLQERLQERIDSIQIGIEMLRGSGLKQNEYKKDGEDRQADVRTYMEQLEETLSRPRTLTKFYKAYHKRCMSFREYYGTPLPEELPAYFEFLKLSELLFLLAYLETCFPTELEDIQRKGFQSYLSHGEERREEPKSFLTALMEGMLFQYHVTPSYQSREQIRFLDTFLSAPEQLPNIVKGFTTQEEAWFGAIDKNDEEAMAANWNEMVCAVAEQYHRLKEKGYNYLEQLMNFAQKQVQSNSWRVDVPFRIFEHVEMRDQILLEGGCVVPLVSLFDQKFTGSSLLDGISERTENVLKQVIPFYLQTYCTPVCNVLKYVTPQDENTISNARERLLTGNRGFTDQITIFLEDVQQCGIWKGRLQEELKGLDGLDALLKNAAEVLKENGYWDYPDIQDAFRLGNNSVQELRALSHLLDQIHLARTQGYSGSLSGAIENNNLSDAISYIEKAFQQPESYSINQRQKDFRELFRYIEVLEPEEILPKDMQRLNSIVTQYYQLQPAGYRERAGSFRKTLISHERRSQNSLTSV